MRPLSLKSVTQDVLFSPMSYVYLSVKGLVFVNFLGGLFPPVLEMGYKICILVVVPGAN